MGGTMGTLVCRGPGQAAQRGAVVESHYRAETNTALPPTLLEGTHIINKFDRMIGQKSLKAP